MLWLALHFPQLPLDRIFRSQPESHDQALVLYEHSGNRQLVRQTSATARKYGIRNGQTLASARALCDHLQALQQQPEKDTEELNQLAQWALQYSSIISLQPPDGLLLEIGASLKLFGGLISLHRQIQKALQELGYHGRSGIAPTATAAWLLARSGRSSSPVTGHAELPGALDRLPLQLLNLNRKQRDALHGMGLKTLRDCRKLPRAGLARRLGTDVIAELDRAYGDREDPRNTFQPPADFSSRICFPEPVQQTEALLFPLQRLLAELCSFLQARNCGTQQIRLEFLHPQQPDSSVTLGLLSASRDQQQLQQLWREKLERHQLPAPVEVLTLKVNSLQPLDAVNFDLLGNNLQAASDFRLLLERLGNRLGDDALFGIETRAEHRPEKAWKPRRHDEKIRRTPNSPMPPRPAWLLEQPRLLPDGNLLTLLSGPERIESGWWDNAPVKRDYYIARGSSQQLLWIFRELNTGSWHIQGYFS